MWIVLVTDDDGGAVGKSVGLAAGVMEGSFVAVEDEVRVTDGVRVGSLLGEREVRDGPVEGALEGREVREIDGVRVGSQLGEREGNIEG